MVNLLDPRSTRTAKTRVAQPASSVSLTNEEMAFFHGQGYLTLPTLTTAAEVGWLRQVYDRLFEAKRGWEEGNFFDFVGTDEPGRRPEMPQLFMPSQYEPAMVATIFRRNATAVARQLLGPSARLLFEHALLKPELEGPATPWHQDQAFLARNHRYRSLTIWMPLQDVDVETGCMQFVPGSHLRGLQPHRRLGDDPRVHALEAVDPDLSGAVTCPLPAGGVTIHDYRTLHGAGPNVTANPRRAYAMVFGVRTKVSTHAEYPWNVGEQTARERRYLASRTPVQRLRDGMRTARAGLRRADRPTVEGGTR
jgi:hypothetical protein